MGSAMLLIVIFVVLLGLVERAASYPFGAGGCAGGTAAVGSTHVTRIYGGVFVQTSLEAVSGAKVSIDKVELSALTPTNVTFGRDLIINVAIPSGFKGVLMRLQAPADVSTIAALRAGSNTKLADNVCVPPVVGITHMNRDVKTTAQGTVRFDVPVNGVAFDITVVFDNNRTHSVYAYSRYKVNFVNATAAVPTPVATAAVPTPVASTPTAPVSVPVASTPTAPPPPTPSTPPALFTRISDFLSCGPLRRRFGFCQ